MMQKKRLSTNYTNLRENMKTKAGFHAEARRRGEKPDLTANGRE